MFIDEINEPVILSLKESKLRFYLSLLLPTLLIGFGLYLVNWHGRYKNETYITESAIYKRTGKRKYRVGHFSDLDYAYFEYEDSTYLMFGPEGSNDYMIMDHDKNYDEIKAFLQNVSLNTLAHHRYEYAQRNEISVGDKLGCLDCKSKFEFSAITKWADEKSRKIFKIKKPNIAVCPSCKAEGTVVVSRIGKITTDGLKSLSALRAGHEELNVASAIISHLSQAGRRHMWRLRRRGFRRRSLLLAQ